MRVTVFDSEDMVCELTRTLGRKGQHSAPAQHVPPQHEHLVTAQCPSVRAGEQVLNRHEIGAQGYQHHQNILSTLANKNQPRSAATCQEDIRRGAYVIYSMPKRTIAMINSHHISPTHPQPVASPSAWPYPYRNHREVNIPSAVATRRLLGECSHR